MENYSQAKKWMLCIAIFTCSSMGLLVSPIVHTLATQFPDVPMTTIRSITTIPSMMSFLCGLFLSSLIGKKLPYRTTILAGMTLCLIGGTLPAFWNSSFTCIIIARVIYGLGFAVFAMRNAIITKAFGFAESAKWTGYGYFIGQAASVVFQLISGRLGDINWRYCFMLHGFIILSFTVVFLLFKEPQADSAAVETKKLSGGAIDPRIFIYFAMTLMGTLCLYPYLSSISAFIAQRNLGAATQAGFVTSAYTVGGAIYGVNYGRVSKRFGRWVPAFACVSCMVGYVLILTCTSGILQAMLGGVCCGGGFSWFQLTNVNYAGKLSTDKNRTLHMTIISSAVSGGSFISSYFMVLAKKLGSAIPLFESEIEKTFLIGIILFAILLVLYLVKDFRPKEAQTV